MLTGEIRSQVDRVWDAFWTGGISNPMEVIEQVTYLLFIKRLDEVQTLREKKAHRLNLPIEDPIFLDGKYNDEFNYQDLRWSYFKNFTPKRIYDVVVNGAFPFIKGLTDDDTAFAKHMKDARFTLPPEKAGLLAKAVDIIDKIHMEDRDTKGDLYEYMLSKLTTAGQNGQFRTPRHIIKMMVEMVKPKPNDLICDPACGTAGFLIASADYLRDHYPEVRTDSDLRVRFRGPMFHGFDFDSTMLRIGSMNTLLHGIENPVLQNRDSLAEDHSDAEELYTLVLANPPFAGSLDYEAVAKDLLQVVRTKKTELLFLTLFIRLLKPGGRAAVIVPDGVLFGSSNAHKNLRRILVEDQQLQAVVSMPAGVFKPYAGVSTAILVFTKTDSGGTDFVWFYDMQADGYSLDDKRTPLNDHKHEQDNIPDIVTRWGDLSAEKNRERTAQSFLVPKKEITDHDYDLNINLYKEIDYDEIEYNSPDVILNELGMLEDEIGHGMNELRELLGEV